MIRAEAIYRALLRCYPAAFRQEYGGPMQLMFAEQMDDARQTGVSVEAAVWLRAIRDVCMVAPREHAHVMAQDLRYAFRMMAARPGFTAVAILSLALGIGANTAIFSLWNAVLYSNIPGVRLPEGLVMLTDPDSSGSWTGSWNGRSDGPRAWLTYTEFEQLRDRADAFSGLMAFQSSLATWQVRIDGDPEPVSGRMVSGTYFQVLGIGPLIGRLYTEDHDRAAVPSVVISHGYWQRRFHGSPDVLGKTLVVRQTAFTIIGVTPPAFTGETIGQKPDLWAPLRMQAVLRPGQDLLHEIPPEKAMWLKVFGRLKPAVSFSQAEAQAGAVFRANLESFYSSVGSEARRRQLLDQRIAMSGAARGITRSRKAFSASLTVLLAAVGVLLLIACANLANLLLARGAARRPEIALRLSLGASRSRIVRQLVTESLALAALGGAGGLAAAWFLHGALVGMLAEADGSFHMDFSLDLRVLAFAAFATVAAALLSGMLPAWQVTADHAAAALREGRTSGRLRSGRVLVSIQLGLSLPLLVVAGLFARTCYNLSHADLGFQSNHVLLVRVDLHEAGYDEARRDRALSRMLSQIRALPGVGAASYSQLGIWSGGDSNSTIEVQGYVQQGDRPPDSAVDVVGPGYFSTLGIPIVLGREILESDVEGATASCVINEDFARRFLDRRNPLGMRITTANETARSACQVVGVARSANTHNLRGRVDPRFFLAGRQQPSETKSPTFLIRTAKTAQVMAAVRQLLRDQYASLPVVSARTIEEQVAPLTAQDRTTARLAGVFAAVALILAAIGLYGVLSYSVASRRKEIAVRITLGAQRSGVIGLILRETGGVVLVGLSLGAGLAFAVSRSLDSRLYGIAPGDPATLSLAAALLLLVAFSAAFLPARRASKLDPMTALRSE